MEIRRGRCAIPKSSSVPPSTERFSGRNSLARKIEYAIAAATMAILPLRGAAQDVTGIHPSFQYANVMPANFNPPGLGGLGFIGNDGYIATWGGSQKNTGELWMIPGL